jgi:transcriptional regulator with XRE-family HTH domain
MTTPNRIKFWRQQHGWTLQQLAEASTTTRAQIDKLERGTRRLTVDWMVRLAKPLGCDPRSLMNADAIPTTPPADGIPVHRLRKAGKAGRYRRATTAAPTVPRPYFLHDAPDAYAVIIPDDACAPALRAGQTAFLAPAQKPHAEQPVLVTTNDDTCAFALYIRRSKDGVLLRQLQPKPHDITVPTATVTALTPVIAVVQTR